MTSLIAHFQSDRNKNAIILMPISRVKMEDEPVYFDRFIFYPADYLSLEKLRIIPNNPHDLREFTTLVTGIKPEVLQKNTTIAFATNIDWKEFYRQDHKGDVKLISSLSEHAEKFLDVIRLYKCSMDLPDALPGRVGTWDDGLGFSAAMIYNPENMESYLIAGSVLTHVNVKGVGLELDIEDYEIEEIAEGETGKIAQRALSLRTAALEANNLSLKYFQTISLFEFLAHPDEYKSFDDVKKIICRHIASSKQDYLKLLKRFDVLGNRGDGASKGYRERIVHRGERLENIVTTDLEVKILFDEIDSYLRTVISDLIDHAEKSWSDFLEFRETLKSKLGLN